jgi:hypothetical protein
VHLCVRMHVSLGLLICMYGYMKPGLLPVVMCECGPEAVSVYISYIFYYVFTLLSFTFCFNFIFSDGGLRA